MTMDESPEYDSSLPDAKPLPLASASARRVRRQGQFVATEATRRRMQQAEQNSSPHLEAIRAHIGQLETDKERLERENQFLIRLIDCYRKKEEISRTTFERLQTELKAIDREFVQTGQF
jgi:hypothetical protein